MGGEVAGNIGGDERSRVLVLEPGEELNRLVQKWIYPGTFDPDLISPAAPYSQDESVAWQMEERIAEHGVDLMGLYCSRMVEMVSVPTKSDVGALGFNLWKLVHALPVERCRCAVVAAMDLEGQAGETETPD